MTPFAEHAQREQAHNHREYCAALDSLPNQAETAETLAELRSHIAEIEAELNRQDPQHVVACVVPAYTDPPERIAAAERDRAAGTITVLTAEHGEMIRRGEMKPPEHHERPNYQHIYAMKQHLARLQLLVQQAASMNL